MRQHDETVMQQLPYLHWVDGCLCCGPSQRASHKPLVCLNLLAL